jgi:hypothetical protein
MKYIWNESFFLFFLFFAFVAKFQILMYQKTVFDMKSKLDFKERLEIFLRKFGFKNTMLKF